MSFTIILIPAVLAIGSALVGRLGDDKVHVVRTRMLDDELLARALDRIGCQAKVSETSVHAEREGLAVTFSRGEGDILEAHFAEDTDVDAAQALLGELDGAYTALVQQKVYERLLARAEQQGLAVAHEHTDDEGAIVLTLQVRE
jgi:hypothetical protein